MTKKAPKPFHFKQFTIQQNRNSMKIGTDGVLLGAWAAVEGAENILDIGAGTAVIAIMLAQRNATAQIHAIEIDEAACAEAQENIEASPWRERLTAFQSSIQTYAQNTQTTYDLIASNPPFFSGGTFSGNQDRMSVRHTIKLPHGDLLRAVRSLLAPQGRFCVILPFIEGLRFEELARTYQLFCTKKVNVHPKADKTTERLLLQFERNEKLTETSQLIIQKEARNDWTADYIQLTKDFYLHM